MATNKYSGAQKGNTSSVICEEISQRSLKI